MKFYSAILIIPSLVLSHPYLDHFEKVTNYGQDIEKPLIEKYKYMKSYATDLDITNEIPKDNEKITLEHPTLGPLLMMDGEKRFTPMTSELEQATSHDQMIQIIKTKFPNMNEQEKDLLSEMSATKSKEQIIRAAQLLLAKDIHANLVKEFERQFGHLIEINARIKQGYYRLNDEQKAFLGVDGEKKIIFHGRRSTMEIMAIATGIASVIGLSIVAVTQIAQLNHQQAALKQQERQIASGMGLTSF